MRPRRTVCQARVCDRSFHVLDIAGPRVLYGQSRDHHVRKARVCDGSFLLHIVSRTVRESYTDCPRPPSPFTLLLFLCSVLVRRRSQFCSGASISSSCAQASGRAGKHSTVACGSSKRLQANRPRQQLPHTHERTVAASSRHGSAAGSSSGFSGQGSSSVEFHVV